MNCCCELYGKKFTVICAAHQALCDGDTAKLELQLSEARLALEIAKPSTIHVYSGHVYGPDEKLVEFVDGCARCRIEKILTPEVKQ